MNSKHGLLFHTNVSKIDDRLYLGDMLDARNKTLLNKLEISHILNMAIEVPCYHPEAFAYMHVKGKDMEDWDIGKELHAVADFIDGGIKGGGVLAHCAYGISRGSTAVIAYLIKYRKMGFEEAHNTVQAKRPFICPNSGFVKHLKRFQKELGIKGNEARAARFRKLAEETESGLIDIGLGALPKSMMNKNLSETPAAKRLILAKMNAPSAKVLKDPQSSLNRLKNKLQRQDSELKDFKEYAGNFGVTFQIKAVKPKPMTNSWRQKPTAQPKDLTSTSISRQTGQLKSIGVPKIDGYCCKACSRMLAPRGSLIRHGKSLEVRCDSIFVEKQGWMQGDIIGCKKNLVCPNPRCKAMVGTQCEQGLACSCGFSDNPGYTLSIQAVRAYSDDVPTNQVRPLYSRGLIRGRTTNKTSTSLQTTHN